jgi:hypothetical protein
MDRCVYLLFFVYCFNSLQWIYLPFQDFAGRSGSPAKGLWLSVCRYPRVVNMDAEHEDKLRKTHGQAEWVS